MKRVFAVAAAVAICSAVVATPATAFAQTEPYVHVLSVAEFSDGTVRAAIALLCPAGDNFSDFTDESETFPLETGLGHMEGVCTGSEQILREGLMVSPVPPSAEQLEVSTTATFMGLAAIGRAEAINSGETAETRFLQLNSKSKLCDLTIGDSQIEADNASPRKELTLCWAAW